MEQKTQAKFAEKPLKTLAFSDEAPTGMNIL